MKRLLPIVIALVLAGCTGSPEKTAATPTTAPVPADDAAAVRVLRQVNTAQAAYLKRNRRYALSYDELVQAHLIDADPAKSAAGYEINLRPSADAESYTMAAIPLTPAANTKFFYTDKSGVIRVEQGKEANASSPPLS